MDGYKPRAAWRWIFYGLQVCCLLILMAPVAAAQEQTPDSSADSEKDGVESPLAVRIDPQRVTQFICHVTISGDLSTPAASGVRKWDVKSSADFSFTQRQFPSELTGPLALQAVRQYASASSRTTVGKDYDTKTTLPRSNAVIHVQGSDDRLKVAAAARPLSRGQFDLLQMPCDPLPCAALLPSRNVEVGEKWNSDAWVLPRLAGLEAVTEHTLSCELTSLKEHIATIQFTGKADGAILGSASSVELSGTLTLDTNSQLLTRMVCQMKEKRSPGPVSPGIDVTVNINWKQTSTEDSALPEQHDGSLFERPLALQTPWRLIFQHSPEWHVFNRTDRVIMLRQIRDGALISQCNISAGVTLPPGQHTPDPDFRSDVEAAVKDQAGNVVAEDTVRDDGQWRIRHVQTSGSVKDVKIIRDYYLCTAASGDQFSMMFSHSEADSEAFGDESRRLLGSLTLARKRPALPFR